MTEQPTGARGSSLVEVAAASIQHRGRPLVQSLLSVRARLTVQVPRAVRALTVLTSLALASAAMIAALAGGLAALQARANRTAAGQGAEQVAARARYLGVIERRTAMAAIMEVEPITSTLGRLANRLPAQVRLGALSRDRSGRLSVEVALSDPDLVENLFAGDPALGPLRPSRQWSDESGGLRVLMTAPR